MKFVGLVGVLALLAGCGGGGSGNNPPPPPAVTIPDLSLYLAQWRCSDGGLASTCADPAPQRAVDVMYWRRSDGQDQWSDSVVADDGTYWETTWSYPPHGVFVAANGDGGEIYRSDSTTVSIVAGQDGGTPGIQRFAEWGLYNNHTIPCSQGWTQVDSLDRACEATVTYPGSIVADTIVSEHYDQPNQQGPMERFYMAARWGRLVWEAYDEPTPLRGGAPLVGPSGAPPASGTLSDRRITTTIVTPQALMSVDDYGWSGGAT